MPILQEYNNIYRLEWRGTHTGWDYRLDLIIPPVGYSLGLDLNNPTIINMPIGSIIPTKMTTKYKDYIGAPEIPTLDLKIDLLELPEELSFALTNPTMVYSTTAGNVQSGVIFMLYIKYNGNDDVTPIDYRFVRAYIHYADGKFKYEPNEHMLEIQAVDLNYSVLRNISFKNLNNNSFPNKFTTNFFVDLYSYINSELYKCITSFFIVTAHFITMIDLFNWINGQAEIIIGVLTRGLQGSMSIIFTMPQFYKQTENSDGSFGSALNTDALYLLAYIDYDGEMVGGLFRENDENSLQKIYPNSVADFYNELAEYNLKSVRTGPIGVDMNPNYFDVIQLDINKLYNVSFSVNEEKVKTVTSSVYEKHSDEDTGGDIDKIDATLEGTRNEASWTIPIVFNNMLSNIKRTQFNKTYQTAKPLVRNLYYKDQSQYFLDNGQQYDLIFRIHEYAVFTLKYFGNVNDPTSNSLTPPLVARNYSNLPLTAMGIQNQSSVPKLLADFALSVLQNGYDVLECEIDVNSNVNYVSGGGIGNPWLFENQQNFTFNLINYDSNNMYLLNLATNWKLIESEIDLTTELVKAKFVKLKF